MTGYVFGFASLVDLEALACYLGRHPFSEGEYVRCRLHGHRRLWNVARDNRKSVPSRDHFVCSVSGERIDGFITAINIRPSPGDFVNGIAFRVTAEQLAALDRREGNYDRIDVTSEVDVLLPSRLWTYRGSALAEQRYARGIAGGTAVINSAYHTLVDLAFASHGEDFHAEYHATTDAPEVPIRPLQRVPDRA